MGKNKENIGDILIKAMDYLNNGKFKDSIVYWEKALALNAKNPTAWVMMGQAYEGLANWSKAIECYDKVLAINPQHQSAQWFKEIALEKLNPPKKVERDERLPSKGVLSPLADKVLDAYLVEKTKEYLDDFVKTEEGKNFMQKAKSYWDQIPYEMKETIRLIHEVPDPSERADLLKLYRESVAAQRTADTLFVYERLALHLTNNEFVWNMFVNATIKYKMDPTKCLEMLNGALKGNPKDHLKWGLLGLLDLALGKLKDALDCFNKQLELEPDNLDPYSRISMVYELENNIPKSIEYLEKYVKAFPNDSLAQKDLEKLRRRK